MRPMLAQSVAEISDLPSYITRDPALFAAAYRQITGADAVGVHPSDRIVPAEWVCQLKADGDRFLVEVTDGEIVVYNRAGKPKTSNLSYGVLSQFEVFDSGHWVFDGEIVGKRLLLFDLPVASSLVTEHSPFEDRFQALELLMDEWQPDPAQVVLLGIAQTDTEKWRMVTDAQAEFREGVMLRHRNGLYRPGGRVAHMLKAKFTKECDAIVTAVGVDGHDNVVLSVLDPDNNCVVEIGRASAIGKRPTPKVGDVWQVKFLYVMDPKAPTLYQPRLVAKRTDKEFHECLMEQLTHAYTDKHIPVRTRGASA